VLNRLLIEVTGRSSERAVLRADHVLGMTTVHNLLGLRLANRILEPLWNGTHIALIEILWEERSRSRASLNAAAIGGVVALIGSRRQLRQEISGTYARERPQHCGGGQ